MKYGLAIIFVIPILVSCANIEPKRFTGPNGKEAYSMNCSGMGRTLDACYQKAGEVCPSGYHIIDRPSSVVGVPAAGGMLIAPKQGLLVECR